MSSKQLLVPSRTVQPAVIADAMDALVMPPDRPGFFLGAASIDLKGVVATEGVIQGHPKFDWLPGQQNCCCYSDLGDDGGGASTLAVSFHLAHSRHRYCCHDFAVVVLVVAFFDLVVYGCWYFASSDAFHQKRPVWLFGALHAQLLE